MSIYVPNVLLRMCCLNGTQTLVVAVCMLRCDMFPVTATFPSNPSPSPSPTSQSPPSYRDVHCIMVFYQQSLIIKLIPFYRMDFKKCSYHLNLNEYVAGSKNGINGSCAFVFRSLYSAGAAAECNLTSRCMDIC